MGPLPEGSGNGKRVDLESCPPGPLVAGLVQLPVMATAKRHGKFIADLHADGAGLGKAHVMRVAGLPSADKAGLRGHKLQMRLIAQSPGLRERELVQPAG
jgi:hypothetical protein